MQIRVSNITIILGDLPDVLPIRQHAFLLLAGQIHGYTNRGMLLDALAAELLDPLHDDRREIYRQYMETAVSYLDNMEAYSFTNAMRRLSRRVCHAA
jgi:hypothetical protein